MESPTDAATRAAAKYGRTDGRPGAVRCVTGPAAGVPVWGLGDVFDGPGGRYVVTAVHPDFEAPGGVAAVLATGAGWLPPGRYRRYSAVPVE
jgi:hypothetical protein